MDDAQRAAEFATLVVSRRWTQQFEWFTHVPLALKAGTAPDNIEAMREGRRPPSMSAEEEVVHDFAIELLEHHGICDATYKACVERFGEGGLIDLIALIATFPWFRRC